MFVEDDQNQLDNIIETFPIKQAQAEYIKTEKDISVALLLIDH